MKEYKKVIKYPVYLFKVVIILTTDIIKSRNKIKATDANPFVTAAGLCYVDSDCGMIYIFLPLKPNIDLIAHEVMHAISGMFAEIGAALGEDSEEFYAYNIGYLCKKIKRFSKKIKND